MAPSPNRKLIDLRSYLKFMTDVRIRAMPDHPFKYAGLEDLILREGREYTELRKPRGHRLSTPKMCYRNAFILASQNPGLTYVEGFGAHVIPTQHAWCVDPEGLVVDNTWRIKPGEEVAYIGLPMPIDYVTDVIMSKGSYGVFHLPSLESILTGEDTKWRVER